MKSAHTQQGASLIEVLISLLLVAVTMLGLLGVQLRSMSMQKDSLDRRNAAIVVANFADRLAGNFQGFLDGNYDSKQLLDTGSPPTALTACASSECTNAERATQDWELLQIEVRNRLPGGVVDVRYAEEKAALMVTVGWLDPDRARDHEALKGPGKVDADSDLIDDTCEAIDVANKLYSCYRATIYP